MNINTIVTLSVLVFSGVALYLLVSRGQKKKEQQFLQLLTEFAVKNGSAISHYERWNNSMMGIDDAKGIIFIYKMVQEDILYQQIDLSEYQKCKVYESTRFVGSSGPGTKVVDRIELVFSKSDKGKQETVVEIYNTNHDSLHLRTEPEIAEKWCALANEKIKELTGR